SNSSPSTPSCDFSLVTTIFILNPPFVLLIILYHIVMICQHFHKLFKFFLKEVFYLIMKVLNMTINYIFLFFSVDKLKKIIYYKIKVTEHRNLDRKSTR